MAADYSRLAFSESVDGIAIKVDTTATPGTLIHTSVATPDWDEVWLYIVNATATAVLATVEFGGVDPTHDLVVQYVPAYSGPVLFIPGWSLRNGNVVRVFAATANVLGVFGHVNRITV